MIDDYESTSDAILKPNYKQAKSKATQIWNDFCQNKIPVILNDIVQKIGVKVRSESLSIDGITRMGSDGVCCILYNKNSAVVRQRFTVAHELGHICLEHTSIFGDCNQYSKKSQEHEANAFARELLVPSSDLRQFVKDKKPTIGDITERYKISRDVAFIAIEDNKLLNKIASK